MAVSRRPEKNVWEKGGAQTAGFFFFGVGDEMRGWMFCCYQFGVGGRGWKRRKSTLNILLSPSLPWRRWEKEDLDQWSSSSSAFFQVRKCHILPFFPWQSFYVCVGFFKKFSSSLKLHSKMLSYIGGNRTNSIIKSDSESQAKGRSSVWDSTFAIHNSFFFVFGKTHVVPPNQQAKMQ